MGNWLRRWQRALSKRAREVPIGGVREGRRLPGCYTPHPLATRNPLARTSDQTSPGSFSARRSLRALAGLMAAALALTMPAAGRAAGIRWQEVSTAWGLRFHHHHGGSGQRFMVETVVGGVVLFDYDGDGDLDVFFVDGAALPGYQGETPRARLFRNDQPKDSAGAGPPSFTDVTVAAGLVSDVYGSGAVAGDYDGDGDLDLYVTAFGANRLWRNRGDGSFEDVSVVAGVADPRWSTGAVFSDFDGDGRLDLYVANYVDFTIASHRFCGDRERGIQAYCHPEQYQGVNDVLYRNLGDGRFADITAAAGLGGADHAGLGVVAADFDDDGRPDIYVANDAESNFLFRNLGVGTDGQLTFEDVSLLSGTSHSDRGRAEGGMGVEAGDVDGDGRLDVVVTNFEIETNVVYRNLGGEMFTDFRYISGLAEASLRMVAFGVALADLDVDGDLDLAIANGHILDNAQKFADYSHYKQPNQVFENLGGGHFRVVPKSGLERVGASRGLAAGDLDQDGDLDLVIVESNDWATVWENRAEPGTGWLEVDLAQGPGRDGFALGTRLELIAGKHRQVREVHSGGSYLSQHALSAHFGAPWSLPLVLRVRWPDGSRTELKGLSAGQRVYLRR